MLRRELAMITQKEIAEKLGISRTTVARAINGSPLIREETKKKILELVKETNYEKNYLGSSLGAKKSKRVCALVVKSRNEFYTQEILRGIEEVANEYRAYNYHIDIKITDINDPEEQLDVLKKVLKERDLDGIIITPLDKNRVYEILKPKLKDLKILSLGIRLHRDIPHVGPDHKKQGKIAAGLMSQLLRRDEKILIIDNGDDKVSSKLYLDGFLKRITEENFQIEGPINLSGIEESIEYLEEKLKSDNIKGLYINRYAHDILDKVPHNLLEDRKIVTNGIGIIIKKLIRKKIIDITVMEEIASEGYMAGKRVFEMLYRNKEQDRNWDISKSHIIFYENLED
ncbi:substrate-binding domain-containing protein [Fusobacterium sp. SYSU M8A802]